MWVWGGIPNWLFVAVSNDKRAGFVVNIFRRWYISSSIYSVLLILAVANMFCPKNIFIFIDSLHTENICYLVADPVAKKSQLVRHCGLGRWPEILSLRLRALGRQDIRTMNPFGWQRARKCRNRSSLCKTGRNCPRVVSILENPRQGGVLRHCLQLSVLHQDITIRTSRYQFRMTMRPWMSQI